MNEKVVYWIEIAEYDLETAGDMLEAKRFLYVGFMCHQVIEKILKACYVSKHDEIPPYVHNLKRLASLCALYEKMSGEQKDFLDILEPLNVEARYPSQKDRIGRSLTEEACQALLSKTGDLYQWIKQQLSNTSESTPN